MMTPGWRAAAPLLAAALAAVTASFAQPVPPADSAARATTPVATPAAKPAGNPADDRQQAKGAPGAKRKAAPTPTGGPLWSSLGEPARKLLQPFETQWNGWSAQEKKIWVSLATKFPKLSAEQQAKVRSRITEWAALTPEQRKLARANFRLARQLPSEERVSQWQRYESMTPEQRKVLRIGGRTSNTAAKHAGARTGLAKEAATPLGEYEPVWDDEAR